MYNHERKRVKRSLNDKANQYKTMCAGKDISFFDKNFDEMNAATGKHLTMKLKCCRHP